MDETRREKRARDLDNLAVEAYLVIDRLIAVVYDAGHVDGYLQRNDDVEEDKLVRETGGLKDIPANALLRRFTPEEAAALDGTPEFHEALMADVESGHYGSHACHGTCPNNETPLPQETGPDCEWCQGPCSNPDHEDDRHVDALLREETGPCDDDDSHRCAIIENERRQTHSPYPQQCDACSLFFGTCRTCEQPVEARLRSESGTDEQHNGGCPDCNSTLKRPRRGGTRRKCKNGFHEDVS